MKARKSMTDSAVALEPAGFELVPTPSVATRSISLHSLDAVKHQLQKVYRDMRAGRIGTQDGTRLAFVLMQLARLYESTELVRRLDRLEESADGHR